LVDVTQTTSAVAESTKPHTPDSGPELTGAWGSPSNTPVSETNMLTGETKDKASAEISIELGGGVGTELEEW
jgi:hypothetical protein